MTAAPTDPKKRLKTNRPAIFLVVGLLLCQLFLRSVNITAQEGFLDEGFHAQRAETAWLFLDNPGRTSDGKFLVYYWLGPFIGEHDTALPVSRLAIALISLVTGAIIFLLGRLFLNETAGLLALAIYCILPMAVFHERMALADPFAEMFGCLIIWRSYIFARRSTWLQTVILGILLALAIMAKMTLIMLPLFPVVVSFLLFSTEESNWLIRWLRAYFVRFVIMAGIVVLLWLPIVIPALIASTTDRPFGLLDTSQVINTGTTPGYYLFDLAQNSAGFAGTAFLVLALGSLLSLAFFKNRKGYRAFVFLFSWFVFCLWPLVAIASQTAPRYVVIALPPLTLALAFAVVIFYQRVRIIGIGLIAAVLLWAVTFAIPFNSLLLNRPLKLELSLSNRWYILGPSTTNDAWRQNGKFVNARPEITRIYSDWGSCRLMFYYINVPYTCLDREDIMPQIDMIFRNNPALNTIYFTIGFRWLDRNALTEACPKKLIQYSSGYNDVSTWLIQRGACPAPTF
jgi:4-amino-4-deoxy-L-arabinose transferase-like glycosyltransferase